MERAIALALENVATAQGGPFGAVVVRDGEVIGEGANCVTTTLDPTAHAEMVAIRAACARLQSFELTGCEIYSSCEPCPMCLGAIYWARPDRLYFASTREDAAQAGFDDDFIYRELALPLNDRKIPTVPLMRDEARRIFAAWLASPDRTPY